VFAALLGTPLPVFMLSALSVGSTLLRSLDSDEFPGVRYVGEIFPVICAVFSQKVVQSEARAIVAAMSSASSEAAVKGLSGIMCDAMVVLDEHLMIDFHSPKLDALLLRRAPVNGGAFPSLFHFTVQDRVVQFLAGCDGVAQSPHAHLRDVRGSRLGVQLFRKRFDVFGKTRHVIGVQEEHDDAHPAQPSTEEDPVGLGVGSSSSHQPERSGTAGMGTAVAVGAAVAVG